MSTRSPSRARREGGLSSTAGFVTLYRERGLRVLVFLLTSQTFVAGMLNVLIVVIALRLLDLGEEGVGFLNSAIGIGGLVGAVVSAALPIGRRLSSNFLLGIGLWGIPIASSGSSPSQRPRCFSCLRRTREHPGGRLGVHAPSARCARGGARARLRRRQALWVATIGIGSIAAPLLIAAVDIRGALLITGALLPTLAILLRRLAQLDAVPSRAGARAARHRAVRAAAAADPGNRAGAPAGSAGLGEELFRQGDVGDRFYIVADGAVEIVIDGGVVRETGPGGYFGEISLLRDVPRTATVRAKGDVELFALDRDDFIAAVTGHAASAEVADSVIATRLVDPARMASV